MHEIRLINIRQCPTAFDCIGILRSPLVVQNVLERALSTLVVDLSTNSSTAATSSPMKSPSVSHSSRHASIVRTGLSATACTCTSTSRGSPSTGSGKSPSCTTAGPPNLPAHMSQQQTEQPQRLATIAREIDGRTWCRTTRALLLLPRALKCAAPCGFHMKEPEIVWRT